MRSPKQLPFANIVPFPSAAAVSPGLRRVAHDVAETAFSRAPSYDEDGSFPADDINKLYETRLLAATLPPGLGGVGLNGDALSEVLQIIGWGNLPLGRLFEGHVNAVQLILRYGGPTQIKRLGEEIC
jgi:alkylation response protein AidB-like acyl-CoA dehydrogenase